MGLWKLMDHLITQESVSLLYKMCASALLVVLLLWHVGQAFWKRLWLLPASLLALNAGTLALIGIIAKIPAPGEKDELANEYTILTSSVLISSMIGALLPSISTSPDLSDMWSNVAATSLVLLTAILTIFVQCHHAAFGQGNHTIIEKTLSAHNIMMVILFVLLLVLLTHALALKPLIVDAKSTISEQLEKLQKQVEQADVNWDWETVERNTILKLMMVLTSKPQNVVIRSPCAAIVGFLVLCSIIVLAVTSKHGLLIFINSYQSLPIFKNSYQSLPILPCAFVSFWRWMMIALQEDRPFLSLLVNEQPSFWRQKIKYLRRKLKASRRRLQCNGQYDLKEVFLYTTDFLLVCSAVPINQVVVAMIWFMHVLSALLMQKLIYPPFKAIINLIPIKALAGWSTICTFLKLKFSGRFNPIVYPSVPNVPLGVVCLKGEDARIVRREFVGAANRIIGRQYERARTKPEVQAITNLLCKWKNPSTDGLLVNALDRNGAPFMKNLHADQHGYQYGWALTIICLLDVMAKIERNALGMSEMYERAMDAYWQAIDMVKVVDEEYRSCSVCAQETYASAVLSESIKLQKKKPRWSQKGNMVSAGVNKQALDIVEGVLHAELQVHNTEFNKAKRDNGYVMAPWTVQGVVSYSKCTVCKNLLRWWIGRKNEGENATVDNMVERINLLIIELLACCLSSLPAALDMSTTKAVRNGSLTKITKGIFLVAKGKHLWAEDQLGWPAPLPPVHTRGQLRQWI